MPIYNSLIKQDMTFDKQGIMLSCCSASAVSHLADYVLSRYCKNGQYSGECTLMSQWDYAENSVQYSVVCPQFDLETSILIVKNSVLSNLNDYDNNNGNGSYDIGAKFLAS